MLGLNPVRFGFIGILEEEELPEAANVFFYNKDVMNG
jgi:hypothetical protein